MNKPSSLPIPRQLGHNILHLSSCITAAICTSIRGRRLLSAIRGTVLPLWRCMLLHRSAGPQATQDRLDVDLRVNPRSWSSIDTRCAGNCSLRLGRPLYRRQEPLEGGIINLSHQARDVCGSRGSMLLLQWWILARMLYAGVAGAVGRDLLVLSTVGIRVSASGSVGLPIACRRPRCFGPQNYLGRSTGV